MTATWVDWATPAICTVLHNHRPLIERDSDYEITRHRTTGVVHCKDSDAVIHKAFRDYQAWSEHVAGLIAKHLDHAHKTKPKACKGFQWIGQERDHCDGCGQPYWEHDYDRQINRDKRPFDVDDDDLWKYVPISAESKARVKARYGRG